MIVGRNATCLYTQSASEDQVQRIISLDFKTVTIAPDGEPRARELALDLAERLCEKVPEVRVADLPDGKDPGDIGSEEMFKIIHAAKPFEKDS